jgi:Arc/MetJ family transcription regulator
MEEGTMKKLGLVATVLTLGITAASAQTQPGEGGTVMLTPEQRATVRSMVKERLPDELREKLADRLAERLEMLTPEQRNAVRAAIKERLAVEVREGLSDRLAERIGDLRESSPASSVGSGDFRAALAERLATLTPEQRAAVRSMIRERLPDEMREKLADRLAERLEMLTPEQRNAVKWAPTNKVSALTQFVAP